ncbi:hypothetical protein ACFOG5_24435 [Pedobacter fastidiosus]
MPDFSTLEWPSFSGGRHINKYRRLASYMYRLAGNGGTIEVAIVIR